MVDTTGVRDDGQYGVGEKNEMMKEGEHEDRGEVRVDGDEDDVRLQVVDDPEVRDDEARKRIKAGGNKDEGVTMDVRDDDVKN